MSTEHPTKVALPRQPPPLPDVASAKRPVTAPVVDSTAQSSTVSVDVAGVPKSSVKADNATDETATQSRLSVWVKWLLGETAVGYYLSLALHLAAYVIAAFLFYIYANHNLFDVDRRPVTINASLSDEEVEADRAKLEITQPIDVGKDQSESTIQRIARSLRTVDNGLIQTVIGESLPSTFSNNDKETETDGGSFLFKLPESGLAVTKGSFTAWTVPDVPLVDQPYMIIIEVRLPDDVKSYRVNDLIGTVKGSDGYRQTIPFDSNAKYSSFYTNEDQKLENISGSESIKVRNNKIQLAIKVPGAKKLVRDIIDIRSKRLRENQQLELVFGSL